MTALFPDTSPAAEAVWLEMMRRIPPWRKMELLEDLTTLARDCALAGLRARHLHASESELRRRLADLLLGPELALKAYGPHTPEDAADGQ